MARTPADRKKCLALERKPSKENHASGFSRLSEFSASAIAARAKSCEIPSFNLPMDNS